MGSWWEGRDECTCVCACSYVHVCVHACNVHVCVHAVPTLRSTVIVLDGLKSSKSWAQLLFTALRRWGSHEQGDTLNLLGKGSMQKPLSSVCGSHSQSLIKR